MLKTFFLCLLVAAIGLGTYLFFYLGVYKDVEIQTGSEGPLQLLYQDHMGAYNEIDPILRQAEAWSREHGLPCPRTFGEFLDDPQSVDQDRLRSHAGCVLGAPPSSATDAFTFETRPERRYVIAHFKGSPAIGPFKVYPKVRKYMEERRLRPDGPNLELYHVNGDNVETEYLFPIADAVQ